MLSIFTIFKILKEFLRKINLFRAEKLFNFTFKRFKKKLKLNNSKFDIQNVNFL